MNINLATKITIFRVILIPFILLVLLYPYNVADFKYYFKVGTLVFYWPFIIALIVFVIAAVSDAVDGHIARSTNTITNLGKFLDPIADKLLVNSLLIYLASVDRIPVILVIVMVARDSIIDALRLLCIENRKVIAASKYGKIKTILQMVSISLVLLFGNPLLPTANWLMILLYLTTVASVFSGIDYLLKNIGNILK